VKRIKTVVAAAATVSALCAPWAVQAQATAPDMVLARNLAATCANCHGSEGRTVPGSSVPSIAGLPRDYMVAQMKAFKDGSRPATVMHQLTKGLTDQQIESMADYFAALKR
jgi:cytochrome c553